MSDERKNHSLSLIAMEGEILPEEQCFQSRLRMAVFDGVTEQDVKDVVQSIVAKAKSGDATAQKMLFDNILGVKTKPTQIVVNNHFDDAQQAERITRGGRRSRDAG